MSMDAYQAGYAAYHQGNPYNPYPSGSEDYDDFEAGYQEACEDDWYEEDDYDDYDYYNDYNDWDDGYFDEDDDWDLDESFDEDENG